jgi:putative transposase
MKRGFMYLTAIIDVSSRFIVGWSLNNTLATSNCVEVLKNAIAHYGVPEIMNSDQGSQFTDMEWLEACNKYPYMQVSMDGRGLDKDDIWVERFWKTIKYEYIYIQPEENGRDLYHWIDHKVPSRLYTFQADRA